MPKILTKRPRTTRVGEYAVPNSPFQKMIDTKRLQMGLSFGALAERVVEFSGRQVNRGTLWVWLHTKNGFPHPKSFKEYHIDALALALDIPVEKIRTALDASRHRYTPRENPVPHESGEFIEKALCIFESMPPNTKMNIGRIVDILKRLRDGASFEEIL